MMESKIQKFSFLAMSASLFLSTTLFFAGAYWVKFIYDRVDRLRLEDSAKDLKSEVNFMKQNLLAETSGIDFKAFRQLSMRSSRRDLQTSLDKEGVDPNRFDTFAIFSRTREEVFSLVAASPAANFEAAIAKNLQQTLNTDASIFDSVTNVGSGTAIILFEGKPLIIVIRAIYGQPEKLDGLNSSSKNDSIKFSVTPSPKELVGFAIAGRWFSISALADRLALPSKAFDLYILDGKSTISHEVEDAKSKMTGDAKFYGHLQRRGGGVGYIRFDDHLERPVFILKYPWIEVGSTGERGALALLLVTALIIGGVIHLGATMVMSWIIKQRRTNPGMSGLSTFEFRETVESFPGFAFAVDKFNSYIAVSRPLAGLMGKESSDFVGQEFGQVASETGMDADFVRKNLAGSKDWPALHSISMSVAGLSERSQLDGVCHWLNAKECLFIVMQKSDKTETKSVPVILHAVYEPPIPAPLRNAQ